MITLGKQALFYITIVISFLLIVGLTEGKKLRNDYKIKSNQVTLSGLSGGGSFAQMLHLDYSSRFTGIGIFAAFFYRCGNYSQNINEFYAKCGNPGGYPTNGYEANATLSSPSLAINNLKEYAESGLIDPLKNLKNQKVFMWQGTIDVYITPNNGLSALDIYEPYLANKDQIYTKIQYANHHLPTLKTGLECINQSSPYVDYFIGKCQYNGPYNMLNFLLGKNKKIVSPSSKEKVIKKNLFEFDQSEFFTGIGNTSTIGLAEVGFIYVPTKCQSSKTQCYLHFYFHGCFLTQGEVGTNHIIESGFLQVAELNNIIVVFPMANITTANPEGCFDFFGYTGTDYAMKTGKQITVLRKIMKRLFS